MIGDTRPLRAAYSVRRGEMVREPEIELVTNLRESSIFSTEVEEAIAAALLNQGLFWKRERKWEREG